MWRLVLVLAMIGCGGVPSDTVAGSDGPAAEAPAKRRMNVKIPVFREAHASGVPVLDVRTPAEFAAGHVPGAVNVPVGELTPDHPLLASLAKDEPVYVVCESGGRSAKAADALAKAGYDAVNVEGGTSGWKAAGLPVE